MNLKVLDSKKLYDLEKFYKVHKISVDGDGGVGEDKFTFCLA
jgi:hypothetical protein